MKNSLSCRQCDVWVQAPEPVGPVPRAQREPLADGRLRGARAARRGRQRGRPRRGRRGQGGEAGRRRGRGLAGHTGTVERGFNPRVIFILEGFPYKLCK